MEDGIEQIGLFCGPLPDDLEKLFNLYNQGDLSGLSIQEKTSSLQALNEFLAFYHFFDIDYALRMERFRNYLEGSQNSSQQERPHIVFSLKSYRLEFTDPTNGTFTLHSEASVGVKLKDAIAYLQKSGININEDEFLKRLSLGSIIWTDNEKIEQRLSALLKVRVQGGQIEEYQSYFRFGETTRNIWLIQNFNVKIHHKGDFRNLPFDCFPFEIKYSVGMGADVVHTNLDIDACHKEPKTLFSYDFDAGEYEVDQKTAHLVPAGLLQDPTCYFENIAYLRFWTKRNGRPIVLRIVLPLLFMICMTLMSSIFIAEPVAMVTQMIPSIFLAMVALQLTASYGMPRGAPFSRLDMLFVFSYSLLIILFMHYLLIGNLGIFSILLVSIFYFLGSWILMRGKYRSRKTNQNILRLRKSHGEDASSRGC